MAVTKIDTLEHLLCRQGLILAQVSEGTVGAGGLQSLVAHYFGNNEGLRFPITIHQAYFLSNGKLREQLSREVIVGQ